MPPCVEQEKKKDRNRIEAVFALRSGRVIVSTVSPLTPAVVIIRPTQR